MKVLMVDPKNFDVRYSINPWMNLDVKVSRKKMLNQWTNVNLTLRNAGIDVLLTASVKGLPDMVFAANAGMAHKEKFILSRFKYKERQGEEKYFYDELNGLGFSTYTLPDDAVWEGEACSVFINDYLFCSFGGRSNKKSYDYISEIWGIPKSKLKFAELIDPYFYHLDVSLCLLDEETALVCPLAFKSQDFSWLKKQIRNIIEVSYDDALNFGCNAVVYENNIFLNKGISDNLKDSICEGGFIISEIDVSEFIKAGGGVKCMTLYLPS